MVWRIFRSWDKREYNLRQGTRAVVLPLCFFGLALSVAIALISVFNMEWIFTAPTRNSTLHGPNHPTEGPLAVTSPQHHKHNITLLFNC